MFEDLGERLSGVFDRLSGRGVLSEKDIDAAMREVRVALLEADVALPVVRDFIDKARVAASGEAVIRSVKPADQVVKIVYDGLIEMLGGEEPQGLRLALNPPTVMLMAGLQGSGKTTMSAKLALRLSRTERRKVLLASLDVRRPAAMEQLAILAREAGVESLPIVARPSASRYRPPGAVRRQARRLRRADPRHRRPHHARRSDDERGRRDRADRSARRDAAGRRQSHRPGRGAHRQGLSRTTAADRPRS